MASNNLPFSIADVFASQMRSMGFSEEQTGRVTDDELNSMCDSMLPFMQYQGVDLVAIKKTLRLNHEKNKRPYSVVINSVTFNQTDSFEKNMGWLCHLYAQRANWDKIKEKSPGAVRKLMSLLASRYSINTTAARGETRDRNVITFSRLASCFPYLVCNSYHNNAGQSLVTKVQISIPDAVSSVILCTHLPAVLPPSVVSQNVEIHQLLMLVKVLSDLVMNRGKPTDAQRLFDYYSLNYNSKIVTATCRERMFEQWGLTASGTLSQDVLDGCKLARAAILKARPDMAAVVSRLDQLI